MERCRKEISLWMAIFLITDTLSFNTVTFPSRLFSNFLEVIAINAPQEKIGASMIPAQEDHRS